MSWDINYQPQPTPSTVWLQKQLWYVFFSQTAYHTLFACGHRPGAVASLYVTYIRSAPIGKSMALLPFHGTRWKNPSLVGKGLINLNTAPQKWYKKQNIISTSTCKPFLWSMFHHLNDWRSPTPCHDRAYPWGNFGWHWDNFGNPKKLDLRPFNSRKSTKHFPTMICLRWFNDEELGIPW